MQNKLLLTLFCIAFSTTVFASNLRDSTGIENYNGKMVIVHKVDPKDSYYSIGRKYNVTPKAIMQYNDNVALQPGSIIKVPTERAFESAPAAKTVANNSTTGSTAEIVEYKVGPKETLLLISKRFNTTVDEIRQLNNLKGSLLSIGQVLKVRPGGTTPPETTPAAAPVQQPKVNTVAVPVTTTPRDNTSVALPDSVMTMDPESRLKYAANRYGLREQAEKGVAVTIDDENVDGSKMLALHRTAPVGTVIKITNPMSGKSTFAKVVGKFTENETTKDVIIVVTKATANLIGALDKRFQVNIIYGVPNEY